VERVAGRAGHFRDDRARRAQERVEEGGLAGVGPAEDGDAAAGRKKPAGLETRREGRESRPGASQAGERRRGDRLPDVFREINRGGKTRRRADEVLARLCQPPREPPLQAPRREPCRRPRARLDQVPHRLRLDEIHPAEKKRALREFPRPRQPGPGGGERREH